MATMSPTFWVLFSTCAWELFARRTVLFRSGWVKRRSTFTTSVFCCLSLTTTPCKILFGMVSLVLALGFSSGALLGGDGHQARDVAPDDPHTRGRLQLPARLL